MTADTLNDGSLDILASIKDADCDPVVAFCAASFAEGRGSLPPTET